MSKPPRPSQPLNPVILIVLGLAIFIYALIIIFTVSGTNKNVMSVFAGIGGLFFLVGLIRLIINKKNKESFSADETKLANQFTNVNPVVSSSQKKIILCSKCRSRNYSTSNFCHMCGMRLR